jgi:hypothetical protein
VKLQLGPSEGFSTDFVVFLEVANLAYLLPAVLALVSRVKGTMVAMDFLMQGFRDDDLEAHLTLPCFLKYSFASSAPLIISLSFE